MRDLSAALALLLVLEGVLYTLFPDALKRMMAAAQAVPSSRLRAGGLAAAFLGVLLLFLIKRG